MGNLFVSEKPVENKSASVDSSMLKAAGPVWHKSNMKNNRLPISGIDTDAKWSFQIKGFGYLDTNYTYSEETKFVNQIIPKQKTF